MEAADESNSGAYEYTIDVSEVEMISLEERMNGSPRKLSKTAGNRSCSIFRVPQSLVETNKIAYQPQIVSIGPYHHGKQHLSMIEEHKVVYLRSFLARLQSIELSKILEEVELMEDSVRSCYSEVIEFGTRQLVDIMVLDGCFIIELFCRVRESVSHDTDDPIIRMTWIFPFLMRDLLRLENQLPFFVLQKLYDVSFPVEVRNEAKMPTLAKLALTFFNFTTQRPDIVINKFHNISPNHLLGLLHTSFKPSYQRRSERRLQETTRRELNPSLQLIQSAKKLDLAGIKFKKIVEEDSYLDVKFRKGVLQMPLIRMDDFTTSLILNSVAYEQCYSHCSNHTTSYTVFMGCLINTCSDVGLLSESKIIENYLGTDDEVVSFFNNIRKDVALDVGNCYLLDVFQDVNYHYRNNWQVQFASFKNTYFNSPWSFISALAALILLLLTMTQSFFAVYAYIRPPK